jgi:hypothetical protein
MARSTWRLGLAGIVCYLVASPVQADQLKMECQVASFTVPLYAGEALGGYVFSFDTGSDSLSVTPLPKQRPDLLFGWDVMKWTLLFARGGHAVFYDIADDSSGNSVIGHVRILSLNFEKPNMFAYWMGGDMDESKMPPQYRAKCRRLN